MVKWPSKLVRGVPVSGLVPTRMVEFETSHLTSLQLSIAHPSVAIFVAGTSSCYKSSVKQHMGNWETGTWHKGLNIKPGIITA